LKAIELARALHGAGGRNFLLLNVPPLERTWQPVDGEAAEETRGNFERDVGVCNERIEKVARELNRKNRDVNVFMYDTNLLCTERWMTRGRLKRRAGF
jgi:phospholipase/lecithinase/hemolysin